MGLTSGFGMRPGKHHRYDRAPIFFRIDMDATSVAVNCELLDEGPAVQIHTKRCSNISAAGLNTSPKHRALHPQSIISCLRAFEVSRLYSGFGLDAFIYPLGVATQHCLVRQLVNSI